MPTRQPVVLDCFAPYRVPLGERRRVLTTVGSWDPATRRAGPVVDGIASGGKETEFRPFAAVPSAVSVPIWVALSGHAPARLLHAGGWRLENPDALTASPGTYRRWLATSLAEFSVAKHAYVGSRSGWFSCRTACYLALGVPAVVQNTGFGCTIPAGEGVLTLDTPHEAVSAIETLLADPAHPAAAAAELAAAYFDARTVLPAMLEVAFRPERAWNSRVAPGRHAHG